MLLCVTVPAYRLEIAVRQRARICKPAIVLADKLERGHVIDLNPQAKALGARAGMTLLQAQAAASDVGILVHDPVQSAHVWEDVLDALDAASPLVDDSGQGTAYLWMRGIAGTPQSWIRDVHEVLCGFDLPFRVAIAENKFTARAAALRADATICEPGGERTLLAPLGIEVLGIEPEVVARLNLLGIATLGELAKLPHGPFVRRFGSRATHWHRNAQGVDSTPFLPRPHHIHIEAGLAGEGAAESEEQIYFALRMLVSRVVEDLCRLGKRAGLLILRLECENSDVHELEIRIAQPTADPSMLFDLARAKIEGRTFDSPVTGLRLQAANLEDGGTPATLFAGSDPDPSVVELAIARLEAALSNSPTRARVVAAHRPEAEFTYEPFTLRQAQGDTYQAQGDTYQAQGDTYQAQGDTCHAELVEASALPAAEVPPQIRLLQVREIDVRVIKNAPAFVGSPPQAVLDFAGPWRIDEAWFENAVVRDEYDVLLEDGTLCRIFRQDTHWYLRGAYD
jgi:protein ImuB